MTTLAGGNALSPFRARQLQSALADIHPGITGIAARFVHLVLTDTAPAPAQQQRLAALLRYGDPYAGPVDGCAIIVTPRLGTLSPWASKATDIARNCGLAVRHLERSTEYRIRLRAGRLTDAERDRIAALLHDRMTESVLFDPAGLAALFTALPPARMEHVDVLGAGRAALAAA
ncbi:phosphoribosylformylglycinamidine synthase, partial [Verminephrobacter sp. Larva24]